MKIFDAPGTEVDWRAEVALRAARLAAAANSGRDFLVLPVTDNREAALWILASFSSPAVVVPTPGNLPPAAMNSLLRQLPQARCLLPTEVPATTVRAHPKNFESTWVVLFSSGSTGDPKGVALHGHALKRSAEAHATHNGSRGAHWLLNLPLFHVGGLSVVSRAYFLGAAFSLASTRFDAADTLNWIERGEVDGLSVVPTTLTRLLDADPGQKILRRLRLALLGGAPASPDLIARAQGLPIRQTYGFTENSSQAATEKELGTGLRALPGVEIFIDESREIFVRSSFLAKGVFRHGMLEPLSLRDGYYPTGDLGRLENGTLVVEGRKSELVISGGLNIFPAEIEIAAAGCADIGDFAVTAITDEAWGEILCAAWTGSATPDTVKNYLAERLDPRKIPRRWKRVESIPRSATGKVLRAALRLSFEN